MLALRSLPLLLLASPLAPQTTHHLQPGDSIQAAVSAAASGDTILLAPGDYTGPVQFLGKELALVGEQGALATRIRGWSVAPPRSTLNFLEDEGRGALVQGVTIEDSENGAVYAQRGSSAPGLGPVLRACIFRNNRAVGGHFWAQALNGSFLVEDCWILDNAGPALGNVYARIEVRNSVFLGNDGTSVSNAVNGAGVLASCRFFDDPRPVYGDLTMRRCLLRGDGTGTGFHGWGLVDRCTVVGFATGVARGSTLPLVLTVSNSIVRDVGIAFEEGPTVEWCNVEGGWVGTGNFDLDPLFVDPTTAQGDLHLGPGSPCIDAGDPAQLEPDGTPQDVGAYSFRALYPFTPYEDLRTDPSVRQIPTSLGGRLALRALGTPGTSYRVLATLSGTTPGFSLRGVHVPLNPDALTRYVLSLPNTPPLSGFAGTIGVGGYADPELVLAPGAAAGLEGQTMHLVSGLLAGGGLQSASSPLEVEFVPWP